MQVTTRSLILVCTAVQVGGASACARVQLLSGVGTYDVSVSALAGSSASTKRTYVVLPGNPGTTPDDLQFKEFAQYVDVVLRARGFSPAVAATPPNVAVFIAYGVGKPRTVYYQSYVGDQQSTSSVSATTTGSAGTTITSGTVATTTPGGFQSSAMTVVDSWATLDAIETEPLLKEKRFVSAWRTQMTSVTQNADIRFTFPVMLAAGKQYLGENTQQVVKRRLIGTSPEVQSIRNRTLRP